MNSNLNLVAFDCGNSSVRVVLGNFDGERLTLETVYQVENTMEKVGAYYYWDILGIFRELKKGLRTALQRTEGRIDSIGICTWGIDFALFDENANMLGNPLSYRNDMGAEVLSAIGPEKRKEMFFDTGILCDKINSIYRIAGMMEKMPHFVKSADKLLLVPDILGCFFTGEMWNEATELSTSQLMDIQKCCISEKILNDFNIPRHLFPAIPEHGKLLGYLTQDICEELGMNKTIPVVHVASHDTASAVVAVPEENEDFIFISSGTWSLIGTEICKPVISEAVFEAGFTNEAGALGTITLLKNSAGMFILQKLKEEYELETGRHAAWDDIVALSKTHQGHSVFFDVNDDIYFNPKSMKKAIYAHMQCDAVDWPEIFDAAYYSLAFSYKAAVCLLENTLNKQFNKIYIIGGGSRNEHLNQMCADLTGKTVVTGAVESTSLGNIGMQLKYFQQDLDLKDIRRIIKNSIDCKTYLPVNH